MKTRATRSAGLQPCPSGSRDGFSRTSPIEAVRRAKRDLARLARPAGSFDARRYFRTDPDVDLGFYNIGASRVRALAKDIVRSHPGWGVNDVMAFAERLMPDWHLEVKAVGVEAVSRYRKAFHPRLLPAWKRWLARGYSANWATTDSICGSLIGPLLVAYPRLAPQVVRWSRDRNMWVRRASAVSLIALARKGDALDAAYEVARILHPDPADLIHKAVGWMLREAGKADAARLEHYLRANGPRMPRTTVRYAIERFPPARRRELLHLTKREAQGPGSARGSGMPRVRQGHGRGLASRQVSLSSLVYVAREDA